MRAGFAGPKSQRTLAGQGGPKRGQFRDCTVSLNVIHSDHPALVVRTTPQMATVAQRSAEAQRIAARRAAAQDLLHDVKSVFLTRPAVFEEIVKNLNLWRSADSVGCLARVEALLATAPNRVALLARFRDFLPHHAVQAWQQSAPPSDPGKGEGSAKEPITFSDDEAAVRLRVLPRPIPGCVKLSGMADQDGITWPAFYSWQMRRQAGGEFDGCWMLYQMQQIIQTVAAYDQDKHGFKRSMTLRTGLQALPNIKIVDTGRHNNAQMWTLRHEYDPDFGPLKQGYARETLRLFWRLCGDKVRLITMEILTDSYGRPWGPPRPYQYSTDNGKTVKERWL